MSKLHNIPKLALYHYQSCPFCAWTRSALGSMDLDVELRDIQKNDQFRKELIQGGGRRQVPSLRIEEHGEVNWLYESGDIVRYLQQLTKSQVKSA